MHKNTVVASLSNHNSPNNENEWVEEKNLSRLDQDTLAFSSTEQMCCETRMNRGKQELFHSLHDQILIQLNGFGKCVVLIFRENH